MSNFSQFLRTVLEPTFGKNITDKLLREDLINSYFRRAFTHRSFVHIKDDTEGDYEVFEKLGDRILKASVQHWLYEILFPEVTVSEPYAELEKVLEAKDQLEELSEKLKFDKYIRVYEEFGISKDIKEDVFEAFIGALSIAGDTIIPDFGIVLAKRWIFRVYNTYVRHKVDVNNLHQIKNFRSQVNEIWSFNGWGNQNYHTTGDGKVLKDGGIFQFAAVELIAPNIPKFPAKFRGKLLGEGYGDTLAIAREMAAENALKTLGIIYEEFRNSEIVVRYEDLVNERLKRDLANHPQVFENLMAIIKDKTNIYNEIQIRTARIVSKFVAQLRVVVDGNWKNDSRAFDDDKENAMVRVINMFIKSNDTLMEDKLKRDIPNHSQLYRRLMNIIHDRNNQVARIRITTTRVVENNINTFLAELSVNIIGGWVWKDFAKATGNDKESAIVNVINLLLQSINK